MDALHAEFPDVDVRTVQVDLASQKSVRAAATKVLAWDDVPEIHVVVNNAAVLMLPERTLSQDGLEMHFATNHVSHFLLTTLLLPKLLQAAAHTPQGATRVVNIAATMPGNTGMRWSDRNFDRVSKTLPPAEQPGPEVGVIWGIPDTSNMAYVSPEAYLQSKKANVLFGIGLTDRLFEKHGILGIAVHPGVINTDISRHLTLAAREAFLDLHKKGVLQVKSQGAGAATTLVAALDPRLAEGVGSLEEKAKHSDVENYGAFLADCQISQGINPLVMSSSEAARLWTETEKLVGETIS